MKNIAHQLRSYPEKTDIAISWLASGLRYWPAQSIDLFAWCQQKDILDNNPPLTPKRILVRHINYCVSLLERERIDAKPPNARW